MAERVYLVGVGEHAEGQEPKRAFRSLKAAQDWVKRVYEVDVREVGVGTWMATWNGCDEVWVFRMKLWDA